MKKLGIGEIAREIGWPALIRQIEESKELVAITRGNESVAVLMPCNDLLLRFFEDAMSWGKVLSTLSKEGDAATKMYLVHQIAVGFMAKMALTGMGDAERIAAFEKTMADRLHEEQRQQRDRAEDRATVETDLSAAPVESKSRRRKSAALPKRSSPRKR